jgi:hypothetical protein
MAVLRSKSAENRCDVSVIFRGKVTPKRQFISRFFTQKGMGFTLACNAP